MKTENHYFSKEISQQKKDDLPIFLKWMDFVKWLIITVEKFPKKSRFTCSDRMINLSLDIVENITEARYTQNKVKILKEINLKLEKLRILMRICFESKFMPHKTYQYGALMINEVGQMLGGWIRQQGKPK